jgi:NADH dehydrogenase FAD-containing subunit
VVGDAASVMQNEHPVPGVAQAAIQLRLAAEDVVTHLLLWRELRLAGLHRIELGRKGRHLR